MAAFIWTTVFQLLLAAGAPLGHLAWGGANRVLPRGLRLASAFSALLTTLGAVTLGQSAGLLPALLPPALLPWLLWGFTALFSLSILGNVATESRPERLHGVPLTLIIASCCLVLALG